MATATRVMAMAATLVVGVDRAMAGVVLMAAIRADMAIRDTLIRAMAMLRLRHQWPHLQLLQPLRNNLADSGEPVGADRFNR